ncbi:MAG: VWA domain-containing protein [Gemmatimonadetes bacterium]|nr:VWA domain-containing protein [Gemmatimonadota bacterium]
MCRDVRLSLIAAVCVGALLAARPSAQPPGAGQEPAVTFRTDVNFVEVHAIVTDETGAFVRNLSADDFEILENGASQKPAVFHLVDVPSERPFVPAGATGPVEADVRATTRSFAGRVYVLLLDDLHTTLTRTGLVQDAARRFVQQYLGADDLAAVVYTSGRGEAGQELTNSRRLLLAAIDRFQGRKLPSASVEKLAVHLRAVDDAAFLAGESQPIRTTEQLQAARTVRDPDDPERGLRARRTLTAIENVAAWLSDVQGRRKALLLFSEGIDYDVYEPFNRGSASGLVADAQQAVAAAQRANVNVYAIDPRGLDQLGPLIEIGARSDYPQLEYGNSRGALRELLLSQESLISLSEETGGLAVVNTNDVAGGLGAVVLDNSRYYLLGYHSDPSGWAGKFLKIDVRVKRPGLRVRARRGYLPPDPRAAAATRTLDVAAGTSPALAAALSKPVPVGDLPLRVFAAPFKGTARNPSVLVAIEIDGPSLRFEERDGRFTERVEISIVAADQRARVQGGDRQTFDLNLLPQTYERVRSTGVRLLSRLDLPPGRYQIHVGAYEATGGTTGTLPYDLEVPDYRETPFALSGILLTSLAADAYATPNPDPELADVLSTPPVATRTFSPLDTLTLFAELYDNSSRTAHTTTIVTTVQDAREGRTVFESRASLEVSGRARTDVHKTELPLKGLNPGLYVLRVEAAPSAAGGHSDRREVLFEVSGARNP